LKRFLLFAGMIYYPYGGWKDFKQDFDTLEEAQDYVLANPELVETYTWYHIADTKHNEIVQEEDVFPK
jgi:hypothetical protein